MGNGRSKRLMDLVRAIINEVIEERKRLEANVVIFDD